MLTVMKNVKINYNYRLRCKFTINEFLNIHVHLNNIKNLFNICELQKISIIQSFIYTVVVYKHMIHLKDILINKSRKILLSKSEFILLELIIVFHSCM